MKTPASKLKCLSPRHVAGWLTFLGVFVATCGVALTHAGEGGATPSAPAPSKAEVAFSPAVSAVLRMADAGVSSAVILTFIECSPATAPLTEAEVIALKQHKVPDEIVSLLLKQGAQARKEAARRKSEAVAQVLARRTAPYGGLDPESYDYFRYYYLQPRALASAYQRLYPYTGPYVAFSYGPPPGWGYPHPWRGRGR